MSDYSSQGPTGNEEITITRQSTPPLRAGSYFISIALFDTGVVARGTLAAGSGKGTRQRRGRQRSGEPPPCISADRRRRRLAIHFPGDQPLAVGQSLHAPVAGPVRGPVPTHQRRFGVGFDGDNSRSRAEVIWYIARRTNRRWPPATRLSTAREPVEAQVLYVAKDASGATTGMATVFSSPPGTIFQVPVLALENRLAAAVANDTSTDASCSLVLQDHARATQGEATFSVPAQVHRRPLSRPGHCTAGRFVHYGIGDPFLRSASLRDRTARRRVPFHDAASRHPLQCAGFHHDTSWRRPSPTRPRPGGRERLRK